MTATHRPNGPDQLHLGKLVIQFANKLVPSWPLRAWQISGLACSQPPGPLTRNAGGPGGLTGKGEPMTDEYAQALEGYAPIATDTAALDVCHQIENALNGIGLTVEGIFANPKRNVWVICFNDTVRGYEIELARMTDKL
jgi:hypothetical protein